MRGEHEQNGLSPPVGHVWPDGDCAACEPRCRDCCEFTPYKSRDFHLSFPENGLLTITVPANRKSLPEIDFDYDATVTKFSFRDGNLFLVAVEDPSRIRVIVSAQLNKNSGSYDGQIFTDTGGNQPMEDNGPVHCTVAPR
ncbi:MAG: hypothetical protein JO216_07685 [Hyphomicrobiales bacterium]|nr:hypothetical protein [Hyphomicrobiales bacterium]